MCFFNNYKIMNKEDLKLIASGDHDAIMKRIGQSALSDEAAEELIERGNHEEILLYVSIHYVPDSVAEVLLRRDNAEEILAYEKRSFQEFH